MTGILRAIIAIAVLGFVPTLATAQYYYRNEDKDGETVGIHYLGNAKWLVEQKDAESHFHKLPRLEALGLLHHAVTYEEMAYVSRLKGIKDFELGIGPESLAIDRRSFALVGTMTQLEGLSLCIDGIDDEHLALLTKLECLEYLDIMKMSSVWREGKELKFESGFTDAAAEHLVQLKSLDWLRLDHHDFSDAFIEKLAALPKLKRLEVASKRFTDKALAVLGEKYRLQVLHIYSEQFTDEGVRALCRAEGLEQVALSSPRITAKVIPLFKTLPKLRDLEVSIDRIGPDSMATLAEMKSLERLVLREALITDADLAALKGHPALSTLFLDGEKLTIRTLDVFKSMPKLEYVNLGGLRKSSLQSAVDEFLKAKQAKDGEGERAN